MFKLKSFLLSLACFCLIFCSACHHCTYSIKSGPDSELKPCPVKFYIESIETEYTSWPSEKITKIHEVELIKKNLLEKYPDFFVDDKSKGVHVNFYWHIRFLDGFSLSAIPSLFLCGVIPCISFNDLSGALTVYRKNTEPFSGKNPSLQGEKIVSTKEDSLQYKIDEKSIWFGVLLTPVSGSIAALFAELFASKEDLTCFGDWDEICRVPFKSCEANLRLFPAACMKYYNKLSQEERQELYDMCNPPDIIFLTK